MSALADPYNRHIRPMLDAIDKLRFLGVQNEGIKLPTIVVVGDQSSGKSSVLESLSGVPLPRGQGIVTRVPLILRIERAEKASTTIEYKIEGPGDPGLHPSAGNVDTTRVLSQVIAADHLVASAVQEATNVLAGSNKGVVNRPVTLTVKRPDAPDLTLIDLPGITRVPVNDQPPDISRQIARMIHEYISPEEIVILNVISAEVDFPTCESILMSQAVDKRGERTLAVVTKIDRAPDGLYNKVISNAVRVGLGFVCVSNKTDADSSHEDARRREEELFSRHAELSQLDESVRGIRSLAARLTQIQADHIVRSLPNIEQQILAILKSRREALASLPREMGSSAQAMVTFNQILRERQRSLEMLVGGNYSEFPEDKQMNYAARLDGKFSSFGRTVRAVASPFLSSSYAKRCAEAMEESRGVSLANFLSHPVLQLLVRAEVMKLTPLCQQLVVESRDYAEEVALVICKKRAAGFPYAERALAKVTSTVMEGVGDTCLEFITCILDKESKMIYTDNHYYMDTVGKIRAHLQHLQSSHSTDGWASSPDVTINDLDNITLPDLRITAINQDVRDMQINLFAYWVVVQKRLCDVIPMEIRYRLAEGLISEIDKQAIQLLVGCESTKVEEVMQVQPGMRQKRLQLESSIATMEESLSVIQKLSNTRKIETVDGGGRDLGQPRHAKGAKTTPRNLQHGSTAVPGVPTDGSGNKEITRHWPSFPSFMRQPSIMPPVTGKPAVHCSSRHLSHLKTRAGMTFQRPVSVPAPSLSRPAGSSQYQFSTGFPAARALLLS